MCVYIYIYIYVYKRSPLQHFVLVGDLDNKHLHKGYARYIESWHLYYRVSTWVKGALCA